MEPRTLGILGAAATVIAGVMFIFAFRVGGDEVACSKVTSNVVATGRPEIVLLADGRSPALESLLVEVHPEVLAALFTNPGLGLASAGSEDDDDQVKPGVITLATYDASGTLRREASFDIAGIGRSSGRRESNAVRQVDCLREAVDGLPDAEAGADLLRTLDGVGSVVRGDSVAVVAVGLSRSSVEGQPLADSVSTPEGRAGALDVISQHQFLPDVDGLAALWFLNPGEGAQSRTVEEGFEAFASDLCTAVALERCGGGPALP